MADQEVALQVKTPPLPGPYNPATPLTDAQTILENQTKLQMLNRVNAGQDIEYQNQLIRNAAQKGSLGGAEAWDAAFREAMSKGATGAGQFIGHYTDLMPSRVFAAYGGTATPAAGATSGLAAAAGGGGVITDEMRDRQYQNLSPPQIAQNLTKNNTIMAALVNIRDQQSHDAAIRTLINAGVPQAAQILGPYTSLNTAHIENLARIIQGNINYLQGRVVEAATGAPARPVKTEMQVVDKTGYDPYNPGRPLTPASPEKGGTDEYGREIYTVRDPSVPGGIRRIDPSTLPTGAAPVGGVTIGEAVRRIQPTENATGNPAATNPRSTATGNYQFTDSTWLDTVKAARPDLAKQFSDKQLLALRNEPAFSEAMAQELGKQNAATLSQAGLPVTTATIALAHRFGTADATKILNAAPNTPLESILSPKVIEANPELKGQTAGGYAQGLVKKVGNDRVNIGGGATTAGTLPITGATPAAPGAAGLELHGEDYLKTLPPEKAGIVRQIVEGRSDFPSGFIMKTPYGQWLSQAVAQAEPGFTAADWNMRKNVVKEWNAGGPNSPAGILTSGNTAIQHLGKLSDAAEKLENWSGWGILNKPLNVALQAERGMTQDPRVSNFESIRNKYIEEATKFYRGTGGNEADLQRDIASLNAAQTPEQLRQAIATQAELMLSKVNALQDRWTHAMTLHDGRVIEPPFPIVQKQSQSALDKIREREGVTGSAPAGGTVPNVDQRDADALRANSHNPAAAAAIDKKYGAGTAAKVLGQ